MNKDLKNLGKQIQESFSGLLKEYLPKDFLEKVKQNKYLKIISVACGKFIEAECLFDYFFSYEKLIKLYGIELDEELLKSAKTRLLTDEKKELIFLKCEDASKPENYEEWIKGELFDLIIIRHPEITFNTDTFMKIFLNCKNFLSRNGYIFITTHHENEKRAVSFLLNSLGFHITVEAENSNAVSLEKGEDLVFADKFLLIAS